MKKNLDIIKSLLLVLIVLFMLFCNIYVILGDGNYKVGDDLENYLTKKLWYKNYFINLYGEVLKVTGVFIIDDGDNGYIVKEKNNQITWLSPKIKYDDLISNLEEFNNLLNKEEIECIFIQIPGKDGKYEDLMPTGVYNYLNENQDYVIERIKDTSIDILDFREELKNDNILMKEAFFNTDHHWKPEVGFWAANKIAKKLEKEYNFLVEWSLLDKHNYNFIEYRQWFLGSIGKQVGSKYAGVDDITLITPNFETSFSFYIPEADMGREGDFNNAILEYSPHCNIYVKDYFNVNSYEVYTGGNYPHVVITNNNPVNNKRILIIKDSSSNVVIPFLIMECEVIDAFDLRYYSSEGSLIDYIKMTKPDVVIVATLGGLDNSFLINELGDNK